MVSIIRITGHHPGARRSSAVYEFICSSINDISSLPNSKTEERPYKTTYPHPGSTCICTDGGISKYILGADDIWHEMPIVQTATGVSF